VAHDASVVNGNRCASASEIDEGDAVLHLGLGKHDLGCGFSCEIFLSCCHRYLGHDLVDLVEVALLADEDLEMAFESVACHSDDVVLDDLEVLSIGE